MTILRAALRDPEQAVQVRALEAIGERDATALRDYLETGPAPQLASVAEGLLLAAEQRGAPLDPQQNGSLVKTEPAGARIIYERQRFWPGSDLSAGTLDLVTPDGARVRLGDSVEVARGVLPAFFSSDGMHVVFEEARTIRVHHVATGETESVGHGIAPRPLPFTDDFVYAVELEQAATEVRGETRITYELRRAPFASATPDAEPIGAVTVTSSFGVSGGASPARWMRIVEDVGMFSLRGENVEPAPLPDPFGGDDR
jgi:hypothetical protein